MAAILHTTFQGIFLYENCYILIQMSLKFDPEDLNDKKSALVQIMAWQQTGHKPWSEPMMAYFTDTYMSHSAYTS